VSEVIIRAAITTGRLWYKEAEVLYAAASTVVALGRKATAVRITEGLSFGPTIPSELVAFGYNRDADMAKWVTADSSLGMALLARSALSGTYVSAKVTMISEYAEHDVPFMTTRIGFVRDQVVFRAFETLSMITLVNRQNL
jgi:hypothetical protein